MTLRKPQRERFRRVLLLRQAILLGNLDQIEYEALRSGIKEISVDNMADCGSENWDQQFNLRLMENKEETLRAINDALKRLEVGTFGSCSGCETAIPLARLEAIPYARYCVECQRAIEEK